MQPIGGFLRIAITDAFETAKTELGLAHNEPRSPGTAGIAMSRQSCSPVMLAFALHMVIRHKADTLTSPQKSQGINHRDRWCDGHAKKSDIEFVAVCLWRTGIRKWTMRASLKWDSLILSRLLLVTMPLLP
jgi:SRSO17 transposase